MSRLILTLIVWCFYLLAINVHIYSHGLIEPLYTKLIYMVGSFIITTFVGWQIYAGFESGLHKLFIALCILSVATTFAMLIAYYVIGMVNYKWNFCTFNGIELLTVVFLLISGINRGLFKNES